MGCVIGYDSFAPLSKPDEDIHVEEIHGDHVNPEVVADGCEEGSLDELASPVSTEATPVAQCRPANS